MVMGLYRGLYTYIGDYIRFGLGIPKITGTFSGSP